MPVKGDGLLKMSLPVQIRLAGSGGQGLILAGIILADAAVKDGYKAVQTQSYGPEARGGASAAEVIISKELITYPRVEKADILVTLTRESCCKYFKDISENALVITDLLLVDEAPETGATVLSLPVVQTARLQGGEIVSNMVVLGALNCAAGLVSWPAMEQALKERVPGSMYELNRLAMAAGRALVSSKAEKEQEGS